MNFFLKIHLLSISSLLDHLRWWQNRLPILPSSWLWTFLRWGQPLRVPCQQQDKTGSFSMQEWHSLKKKESLLRKWCLPEFFTNLWVVTTCKSLEIISSLSWSSWRNNWSYHWTVDLKVLSMSDGLKFSRVLAFYK